MSTDNILRPSNSFGFGRGITSDKPPAYNKHPINVFNPFRVAYGYSDNKYLKERSKILATHGVFIGAGPVAFYKGLYDGILTPGLHFRGMERFLLNSAQFGAIGAVTALAFMGGVGLTSKLRGDKDDLINPAIGGYFLVAPISIYKMSYRFFFVAGTYMAALSILAKHLHMEEVRFDYITTSDQLKVSNARYPELYIKSVLPPLPKQEETQKAIEYQRRDF